jgi:cytochrome b involved in lipid metabolism
MSKTFTQADVAKHTATASDGQYIIIDNEVYDVTNFIDEHPGGAKILKRVCGKDATKQFWKVSVRRVLRTKEICRGSSHTCDYQGCESEANFVVSLTVS